MMMMMMMMTLQCVIADDAPHVFRQRHFHDGTQTTERFTFTVKIKLALEQLTKARS
jgi:hypothetical protein